MGFKRIAFFVTAGACILTVLGDLRGIITPFGYWILWGLLLGVGLRPAIKGWRKHDNGGELYVILFFFVIMFLAFMLSSVINSDSYTLYQSCKILVIGSCFAMLYGCAMYLSPKDYFIISLCSIGVGFVCFIGAKYLYKPFYVILGDGRQGSFFAWPGVLWKTPVFFVGFLIAQLLSMKKMKVYAFVGVISSIYLLLADSSRTGFLWFCILIAVLGFSVLKPRLRQAAIVGCVGIFSISALTIYVSDFSFSNAPLLINRFIEGDVIRNAMLISGLDQDERCLVFGCGFGSTSTLVNGSPMVVHNSYLSSLGDLGLLGLIALLGLLITPLVFFILRYEDGYFRGSIGVFKVAALMGVLGYAFLLLFHPFSTEMSEWGLWAITTSALSRLGLYHKSGKRIDANLVQPVL